ncbi:DUF3293 domain-containing protein [Comamonas resistens]|uniref:DUF3293 domain-containing protein n=1 Tax=Comamonas resistens TaxID=3046670 RepID=A0ABY8ST68_9BURK|nr:DUF3293 domain-containing protein [Comamonas resistens]MDL5036165.1 DUF3293 domain-containing protein [Comamonas resistens]WHS66257.1 DUF3293 domain-containing protein [Comamonas resistens]
MNQQKTGLPVSLQRAYCRAIYRVHGESGPASDWWLQVGTHQPRLLAGYAQHRVCCATYLTACNPHGQLLNANDNALRMRQLCEALAAEGWVFGTGFGEDPQGRWPGEASVLIWGMDALTARIWGEQWQQNAVLWCSADAVPQLLWLRQIFFDSSLRAPALKAAVESASNPDSSSASCYQLS